MTHPAGWYRRDGVVSGAQKLRFFPGQFESGEGCWLIEPGGRRILDLSATWTASSLGYGHPAVVDAVRRRVADPPGSGAISAAHPDATLLAEELLDLVPGEGERRVYFGHAGSDANSVAIRCARFATGKTSVLAFRDSYHGGYSEAMSASGVHVQGGTVTPPDDVFFAPYPRTTPGAEGNVTVADSLASVDSLLASGDFACALVEPILSDGGLIVPADGFLVGLEQLCRSHGVLLVCDEVKVGLARSGRLHAFEHEGITPDIVTFGKGLGAGLPISAAVGPAAVLDGPTAAGIITTAGNPVCTAAARAVLRTIDDDALVPRARQAGEDALSMLRHKLGGMDCVLEVRGRGLVIGVELRSVTGQARDAVDLAAKAVYRLWQLGAVAYLVAGSVIEITPPLTIQDDELAVGTELVAQAIRDAADGAVADADIAEFAGWG